MKTKCFYAGTIVEQKRSVNFLLTATVLLVVQPHGRLAG